MNTNETIIKDSRFDRKYAPYEATLTPDGSVVKVKLGHPQEAHVDHIGAVCKMLNGLGITIDPANAMMKIGDKEFMTSQPTGTDGKPRPTKLRIPGSIDPLTLACSEDNFEDIISRDHYFSKTNNGDNFFPMNDKIYGYSWIISDITFGYSKAQSKSYFWIAIEPNREVHPEYEAKETESRKRKTARRNLDNNKSEEFPSDF